MGGRKRASGERGMSKRGERSGCVTKWRERFEERGGE